MTKNVLSALFSAARGLLRDWRALLALAFLYAALIAAFVLFITTREATTAQLALTALAAVAVPVLFCAVAAAAAAYAVGETRPAGILRRALGNFLKVLTLSLPILALVVGTVWAMNKLESRVKHDPRDEASAQYSANMDGEGDDSAREPRPKPKVRWAYVFYSALRLLLLGVLLPLIAVHLWIAATRDGLGGALRKHHRVIARALSARSVFTYTVGMIVFALLPYFLIIKRTPASAGSVELTLLSVRLLAAFALTLFGFVATATALARYDAGADADAALARQPDPQPRPAEPASVTS
ncbi:MAG: hypothetical protein LC785_07725 [Acidobacteria bacterium]|nr:hypothetical protein [Acidobacteriota bacterium]MCA1641824.1 hypothetical protein [Acidobacteriota bacterium]